MSGLQTEGALLWEPGTGSGWSVEAITLDPPAVDEVLVELHASGICHSDAHLDTGDIVLDWSPVLGGHEGAGIVLETGREVRGLKPGDHVVLSFLPSCGSCRWCVSGRGNLCDLGVGVLAGKAPDGTHRIHARGRGVGAMSFLGTFSPYAVVPSNAAIRIDDDLPLELAALIGCGVPTGWGSAVYAAETQIGDTVVVVGTGGVGMNAVQGARHAGAARIVAVEPVETKRLAAPGFGATDTVGSLEEALDLVGGLTRGVMADRVIVTVGVARGDLLQPAAALTRKGGTLVVTSAAPMTQATVQLDLFSFAMSGKRLQGTLYGSTNARNDVPLLIDLYRRGELDLDGLITRRYELDDINVAFEDMDAGRNIRGVITYTHP